MLIKKQLTVFSGVLLFAAYVGLTACGGGEKNNQQEITDSTETEIVEESTPVSMTLPSPLQIAQIFKRAGLTYIDGLLSKEKPEKYNTKAAQAVNLGVFSADLGYCTVNDQRQEAMNYMKLSRELAGKLGMLSVFDENSFPQRFEKNLGNEDSLVYIIAEIQLESDMYVDENDMKHISAMAFAGAWIESIDIGAKASLKKNNDGLGEKIAEQMTILERIINVLNSYQAKDEAIPSIVSSLKSVQDVYNNLESVKKAGEDPDGKIVLSKEEIEKLSSVISGVRSNFIAGSF